MLVLISNTVNKHLQKVVKQSKFAKTNIDIRQNRNVFIEMQRIPNENWGIIIYQSIMGDYGQNKNT